MKFKLKRIIVLILIFVVTIVTSFKVSQHIEEKEEQSKNMQTFFNTFVGYLHAIHYDLPLIRNDEIMEMAEENIKANLHKLIGLSDIQYKWCYDIFIGDEYIAAGRNGEILDFFYDLNSFLNQHDDFTIAELYTEWYKADGKLTNDEIKYINNKMEIIEEMYENCFELYQNSQNNLTVDKIRNAILEPLNQ